MASSQLRLQSEWVMTELRKAERQSGQRKLFPVRLAGFATRNRPPSAFRKRHVTLCRLSAGAEPQSRRDAIVPPL